jgi:hypothetical protein
MINQNNTTLMNACPLMTISTNIHQAPLNPNLIQVILPLSLANQIKQTYPIRAATLANRVIFINKSQLVTVARRAKPKMLIPF